MNIKSMLKIGISLTAVFGSVCYAEIYKYKDKQGNWQYSDKPPKDKSTKIYIHNKKNDSPEGKETNTEYQSHATDLKALLYKKYNPGNSIERASLATVTIETHLAIGSGFFNSNNGYILTNKHVVRPSASSSWQETNNKFNEQKFEFKKNLKKLGEEKERRRDNVQSSVGYLTARYENLKTEYEDRKQFYNKTKPKFDKKKRAFNKEYSNFNIKSSMANVTKSFKVILKNEQTLSTRLITVSKEHDLALLELNRYTTPYIKTNTQRVHQTMIVYAGGCPLGIRDSVPSGIITGIKEDYVRTDTKILPGNSGNPLLSKDGTAIGVNTARVSEFKNSEGLGIAIPMAIAHKEFTTYLPGH